MCLGDKDSCYDRPWLEFVPATLEEPLLNKVQNKMIQGTEKPIKLHTPSSLISLSSLHEEAFAYQQSITGTTNQTLQMCRLILVLLGAHITVGFVVLCLKYSIDSLGMSHIMLKCVFGDFQPHKIQTSLLSYRSLLET